MQGASREISGAIENWLKWKWIYADINDKGDIVEREFNEQVIKRFVEKNPNKPKCKVRKTRYQRKFKIEDNSDPIPVPLKEYIEMGFKAELTELRVNGSDWWTIAFEIVGEVSEPISKLTRCVHWITKDYPGKKLQADNSYSYPEWLSKLNL